MVNSMTRCRWDRNRECIPIGRLIYYYNLRILFFTKPQEVEEALEEEAKKLRLADGGVLLESLRTRRLLETAELALKVRRVPS